MAGDEEPIPLQVEEVGSSAQEPTGRDVGAQAGTSSGGGGQPARGGQTAPVDLAADLLEALQGTGAKGRVITEAIIAAGLSDNPQALRRAYQENRQAINAYLRHVNTEAVAARTGSPVADRARQASGSSGAGFVAGAAVTFLINRFL